jgi:hypothetical protein
MRLTVIPEDKMVIVDLVAKSPLVWEGTPNDVHALQWYDTYGVIELKNPTRTEDISELPQWALNAVASWEVGPIVPPLLPATAEQNKITAAWLLSDTDWTTIPDVADPAKSNPHLGNVNEFLAYRNAVRAIAINPVAGNIDWPVKPASVWLTT